MTDTSMNPDTPQRTPEGMGDRASATADNAKEQAASVAEGARSQASDVAAAAGEQARAVAEDAKHQARRVVDDSRQHLRDQAAQQTTRLAGSVRDVSSQLQRVARGDAAPQGVVGDLTQQAASFTGQLADQLEQRSPEELLDEVRRFARRRPGMFLLGALGAGFVAGRLVHSADTRSIVEAAKSGAEASSGDGSQDPAHLRGTSASLPAQGGSTQAFPDELTPAVRP